MRSARTAILLLFLAFWALPFSPAFAGQQPVQIRGGDGEPGKQVTYTLTLSAVPREIRALGLEVAYDPKVLRYTGTFSRGPLTESFEFYNVNEPKPGQIRLGGFTVAHRLPAGSTGDLATLHFERLMSGDGALRVERLVDDLAAKEGAGGPSRDQDDERPGSSGRSAGPSQPTGRSRAVIGFGLAPEGLGWQDTSRTKK